MQASPTDGSSHRCVTCKLRKVKCTGGIAPCGNCRRLKLNCTFSIPGHNTVAGPDLVSPTNERTEAGTARLRVSAACRACQVRKTKCDGRQPRCVSCQRKDLSCSYVRPVSVCRQKHRKTERNHLSSTPTPTETNSVPDDVLARPDDAAIIIDQAPQPLNVSSDHRLLSRDVLAQHIEAYFTNIYHLPGYNFFHRPSILEDLHNDKITPILGLAICATVSAYLDRSETRKVVSLQWAADVDAYISANMNNLNIINLQVIMLSLYQHFAFRQFGRSWLLLGLATRLAVGIQLNRGLQVAPHNTHVVAQECNKRLAWSIYIHDKLHSGDVEEFVSMPRHWMRLALPVNDDDFLRERNRATGSVADGIAHLPHENLSFNTYIIVLMTLRYEVLRVTKSVIGENKVIGQADIKETLEALSRLHNDLQLLYTKLPQHLSLSDRSIFLNGQTSEIISYVSFYTWFFQSCCDLYRLCLPGGGRERARTDFLAHAPEEFVVEWQRLAVASALKLALFWKHLLEMKEKCGLILPRNITLLDPTNCICVCQCTKLLLVAWRHELLKGLIDPITQEELLIDEQTIQELGRSNLLFIKDLASRFPIAAIVQQDVKSMLDKEFANGTMPSHDACTPEQTPVTSQVQKDHILSRYNVLAMGIAASNDGPEVPQAASPLSRPAISSTHLNMRLTNTSESERGRSNTRDHSICNVEPDSIPMHSSTTESRFFNDAQAITYPQQMPLQYTVFNNTVVTHITEEAPGQYREGPYGADLAIDDLLDAGIMEDYVVAGSQYDMRGELDWFLVNSTF